MGEPSKVIEAVEVSDDEDGDTGDRPLMRLLKRLLGNDNKQKTVVTNTQIINILQKEFAMDISQLHELEIDVYLNIMKKFLKEWPQWDEFDKMIKNFKSNSNEKGMKEIIRINNKYDQLKEYLTEKLDIARPLTQEKVQSLRKVVKRKLNDENEFSDVVMEVKCTRSQLYNLFYRYPQPGTNNIFNLEEASPSKICLEDLEYEDLFRWWNVGIVIIAKAVSLTWQTVHDSKYILVNKKLNFERKEEPNFLGFQENFKQGRTFNKSSLMSLLKILSTQVEQLDYSPPSSHINLVLDIIKSDLDQLPDQLKTPCSYRRNLTKYPYVRYLYKESTVTSNDKYDLQLEETMSPRTQININRFLVSSDLMFTGKVIAVECTACDVRYNSKTMLEELKLHIIENHMNEPDFQCKNCKQSFTMIWLIKNLWQHACEEE